MATFAQSRAVRERYLRRLARAEADAADPLIRYYKEIAERIEREIVAALEDPTLGQQAVMGLFDTDPQTARIAVLQGRANYVQEQLARFARTAHESLIPLTAEVVAVGVASAGAQMGRINASWVQPNRKMIEYLVATLQPGTAEFAYWQGFAGQTAQRAMDTLVQGVILGQNPSKIAAAMRGTVDAQAYRVRTAVRTQVMNAARAATGMVYEQNADVVPALVWTCVEDANTCEVCWAMNGTVMQVGDTIDSHPNCRCEALPLFEDERPDGGFGERLFDADDRFSEVLSDDEQLSVLGPSKYALYKDGEVALPDLVEGTQHPVWGPGRRSVTLGELGDRGVVTPSALERVAKRKREA